MRAKLEASSIPKQLIEVLHSILGMGLRDLAISKSESTRFVYPLNMLISYIFFKKNKCVIFLRNEKNDFCVG